MKYDFSKIDVFDIDEKKFPMDVGKKVAGWIYLHTRNLELVDIALRLNKGEVVDLRPSDVVEIRRIIDDPQLGVFAFLRKALKDFFESKESEAKNGT